MKISTSDARPGMMFFSSEVVWFVIGVVTTRDPQIVEVTSVAMYRKLRPGDHPGPIMLLSETHDKDSYFFQDWHCFTRLT